MQRILTGIFSPPARTTHSWQRSANTPPLKKLHLRALHIAQEAQSAIDTLVRLLANAPGARVGDKKRITEDNFEGVFDYWNDVFGESVRNSYKSLRYFVADIQSECTLRQPAIRTVLCSARALLLSG